MGEVLIGPDLSDQSDFSDFSNKKSGLPGLGRPDFLIDIGD